MDELKRLLKHNYEALGFILLTLDHIKDIDSDCSFIRGSIRCPCGGVEYFMFREPQTTNLGRWVALAKMILSSTANRKHLERDVEEGTLPPFDVAKHAFNGTLLIPDA